MTSGAVSSFIDVVLNFGKSTVTTDNVLLQAKNHGHNIIFYGDDTWLKLYPNIFNRFDGTTSFFVSDYTEVRKITQNPRKKIISVIILILIIVKYFFF